MTDDEKPPFDHEAAPGMTVVIFDPATGDPNDPNSGSIVATFSGSIERVNQLKKPWVQVDQHRHDFDRTHTVLDRKIVPQDAEALAAKAKAEAWAALRRRRDGLLRHHIDTLSPLRLETMSETSKAAWRQYRLDLLNLPATTADPRTPVWPTPPAD